MSGRPLSGSFHGFPPPTSSPLWVMPEKPKYDEMSLSAKCVLIALDRIGESGSCLIGGMASSLHGVKRDVKDLDIAILRSQRNAAGIQRALLTAFPKDFSLKRPKKKAGRYTTAFFNLYFNIPKTDQAIKVDLLLWSVPEIEIPVELKKDYIEMINTLRVAPLYFVLYHKLLGWEKRKSSGEAWKEEIAHGQDKKDILRLCDIAYGSGLKPLSKAHMGKLYIDNFSRRADLFVDEYNDEGRVKLRLIGFNV